VSRSQIDKSAIVFGLESMCTGYVSERTIMFRLEAVSCCYIYECDVVLWFESERRSYVYYGAVMLWLVLARENDDPGGRPGLSRRDGNADGAGGDLFAGSG
jgi:hypothetical protein